MDQSWNQVYQFHQAFDLPRRKQPTKLEKERVAKRAAWLREEIEEFQQAKLLTEQADAMVDTIYFALGTLVEMGVKPEKLFDIVHQANMSKRWEDGEPRYRESDGKVMKPATWQDPEPLLQVEIKRQMNQKRTENL